MPRFVVCRQVQGTYVPFCTSDADNETRARLETRRTFKPQGKLLAVEWEAAGEQLKEAALAAHQQFTRASAACLFAPLRGDD